MPEAEVVDSPAAPEPISTLPSLEEEPSIEAPEGAASETTEETPPPESRSWSLEEWKEHPEFSEWYEDHARELQLEGQKREYGRSQAIAKKIREEIADKLTSLNGALSHYNKAIAEAYKDDPVEFGRELARNPEAMRAYKEAAETAAAIEEKKATATEGQLAVEYAGTQLLNAMAIIAHTAGAPEMADPYLKRFADEWQFAEDKGAPTFTKLVKSVLKVAEEKGYQRGLNAGKGVTEEVKRGSERAGQGPSNIQGKTGSGRPTPLQYASATPEQRAKWRAAGIEPLT